MSDKHILLINPWIYDVAAYDLWIKPVGLLTIGGVLREYGYKISLIDCLDRYHPALSGLNGKCAPKSKKYGTGKFYRQKLEKPPALKDVPRYYCRYGLPLDIFIQELEKQSSVDAVLITSGMTYWYQGVFKAIEVVKSKLPGVPILLGGIYATLCTEHAIAFSGADYVVKGLGEKKALEILDDVFGAKTDFSAFPEKQDDMPLPAYDLYDHLASLPILTSRGCPFRCPFCASHLLVDKFEQRDPKKVADEVEYYSKAYSVKNFAFWDDALLVNQKQHFSVFLKEILKRRIETTFHTPNGLQPRELDSELAVLMAKTQFRTIRLSYESADPRRQKEMGKVSDDDLLCALANLESAGYDRRQIEVYVMIGLPEQSVDEMMRTILFVHRAGARISLASYSPIPGTAYWQLVKSKYDYRDDSDLLLTNNSIFPLKTPRIGADTFEKMKQLARTLNNALDQGKQIS